MKKRSIFKKVNPVILGMFLIGVNVINGLLISRINILESSLTKDFKIDTFYAIFVCYIMTIVATGITRITEKGFRVRLSHESYTKYLVRVLRSKVSDINNVSIGRMFDSIKDIATLENDVKLGFIWIIPTLIPFGTLLYKEAKINILMPIISLLSVVLCSSMFMITEKMFGWSAEAKKKKAVMQSVTVDNFLNVKSIKFMNKERYALNRLLSAQEEAWPYMVNVKRLVWFRLIDIISLAPLLINIYICRHDVEMIAFIILSNYTLNNMTSHLSSITDNIVELNAQRNIIACLKGDDLETKWLPEISKAIELTDITFGYGEDKQMFYIDNLVFNKDERYLVYGESGEGKSSLANLLTGAIAPTTGTFDRYMSYYIWQETEALDDTLWNNIVFDNADKISEHEVLDIFKDLNMIDWFCSLKDGFNTQIGERGCKLSSGQKQRLNIIRLILTMRYHSSMVFIIDEITSNLDAETRHKAIDLIDKNCKSTLICISHNEGFDKICKNHILVKNHKFIVRK